MGKSRISLVVVEFRNVVVIKVTKGLEFASLGSAKWFESMVLLVNGHSHFEQSHSGVNSSSAFQWDNSSPLN